MNRSEQERESEENSGEHGLHDGHTVDLGKTGEHVLGGRRSREVSGQDTRWTACFCMLVLAAESGEMLIVNR